MIVGEHGRFLFSAKLNDPVRYDRLLRKGRTLEVEDGYAVDEGRSGRFRLLRCSPGVIECQVRNVDEPEAPTASGRYEHDMWTFEGEAQEWGFVEQYVLVGDDRRDVLRIADEATPVALEYEHGLGSVVEVPDSRLAMGLSKGSVVVFDPHTGRVGENLELKSELEPRAARFRPGAEELWVDAGDTLVALETRHWQVSDAAGYESGENIAFWDFIDEVSVMVGSGVREVFLLDAQTMLPKSVATFTRSPIDATVVGDHVYGVDASGRFERARLKAL